MQPIHDLLKRIHWDTEFGKGEFELGFYDRLEATIIRMPFSEIAFAPGDKYQFHYIDEDGQTHSVPFHRIKAVYKNGKRIWHRAH